MDGTVEHSNGEAPQSPGEDLGDLDFGSAGTGGSIELAGSGARPSPAPPPESPALEDEDLDADVMFGGATQIATGTQVSPAGGGTSTFVAEAFSGSGSGSSLEAEAEGAESPLDESLFDDPVTEDSEAQGQDGAEAQDFPYEELAEPEAVADSASPSEPQPPAAPADGFDLFADDNASSDEAYSSTPKSNDSSDLSDIAQFGNSESSGGRDGTLRYNLFISGIDTSDVRLAFREALTDRKFLWDTDQILRSLKNGQVRIENVSATKAHVLISRLRNMPVKVRWEQYAVHQT